MIRLVMSLTWLFGLIVTCESAKGNRGKKPPVMSLDSRLNMREQVRDMFYHAYDSYMTHAWPWDELKPLSCTPRRWDEKERGTLDDTLGGFSLTLVDTLDTLAVMGDSEEFFAAIERVCSHVTFDRDVEVSVFESTIRIIGGLLAAHLIATGPLAEFNSSPENKHPYDNHTLLDLAVDIGQRLLPAFETPSKIPYHRVNLLKGVLPSESRETCTAASTLILEFGILSRVSGNEKFEKVAREAVQALWKRRSQHNLVGNTIDVISGEWTGRLSGIGAGIDSFYEYLMKAYVAFGDHASLEMFEQAYAAALEHLAFGPWFIDVDMHSGKSAARNFMVSSLQAFWPGLQVMAGDISAAQKSYNAFYSLFRAFDAVPEGFNLQSQDLWNYGKGYPLRPEFAESTMLLYQATRDPAYLGVGKQIVNALIKGSKVECGFAALSDVSSQTQEDRMDSFFLSETIKYLYMLFDLGVQDASFDGSGENEKDTPSVQPSQGSGPSETGGGGGNFETKGIPHVRVGSWMEWSDPAHTLFSTEGHLFLLNNLRVRGSQNGEETQDLAPVGEWWNTRICPWPPTTRATVKQPADSQATKVEKQHNGARETAAEASPVRQADSTSTQQRNEGMRQTKVDDPQVSCPTKNPFTLDTNGKTAPKVQNVFKGSITTSKLTITRVFGSVIDPVEQSQDGAELQETIRKASDSVSSLVSPSGRFLSSLAQFGIPWSTSQNTRFLLISAEPLVACQDLSNADEIKQAIKTVRTLRSSDGHALDIAVLVKRGSCTFGQKARVVLRSTGVTSVIVVNGNDDQRLRIGGTKQDKDIAVRTAMVPHSVGKALLAHPSFLLGSEQGVGASGKPVSSTVAFVLQVFDLTVQSRAKRVSGDAFVVEFGPLRFDLNVLRNFGKDAMTALQQLLHL